MKEPKKDLKNSLLKPKPSRLAPEVDLGKIFSRGIANLGKISLENERKFHQELGSMEAVKKRAAEAIAELDKMSLENKKERQHKKESD